MIVNIKYLDGRRETFVKVKEVHTFIKALDILQGKDNTLYIEFEGKGYLRNLKEIADIEILK